MGSGKLYRLGDWDEGVLFAMKEQARLRKFRIRFKPAGVLHQLISDELVASGSIMKDRNAALFSPKPEPFRPKLLGPEPVEAESGREQDKAVDFRMPRGVEAGQVAAEARTDDDDPLAAAQALDNSELFRNGQPLEIAFGEIGNFDREAERYQFFREEARLSGGRTRSKAMQIQDTRGLEQYLHFSNIERLLQ